MGRVFWRAPQQGHNLEVEHAAGLQGLLLQAALEHRPQGQGEAADGHPATEQFTGEGSKEANSFLTREYRKPFVVPDKL